MDAMECKTSGLSFFQKLRRFTNNAAPASVPVGLHHPLLWSAHLLSFQNRYRELLHVSCQWWNLQALKRFGFGHGQSCDPGPGDLALFFPAFPQPGINLPEGWEHDSHE